VRIKLKKPTREYFFGKKGQRLFFKEWGNVDKPVVLLVHGFPGCADQGRLLSTTPHLKDFRLIAMDRPGYGDSEHQPNLTPLKFAQQIQLFLQKKKIKTFTILSVSGGAPYAMAVAFLMQERVLKICSVAGVAPLTFSNIKYLNSQQRKAWVLRNVVPGKVLGLALNRVWKSGLDNIEKLLFTDIETFSKPDQKVLLHPTYGPALTETLKISLMQGPWGVLGDMKVYARPWGFPLQQVLCPITLWHGSKDDVVHVKFSEEMKKRMPQAKMNFIEGEGHYSLALNCRDDIILDLLN
jgi:pimeloyl-ACP methyl ester carboxylesterase